jgi:hypothetical protein
LAQAIGQAAIQQGYKVLYRETHILLDELAEAVADGTSKEYMESVATVPLLIIDDFGMRNTYRRLPARYNYSCSRSASLAGFEVTTYGRLSGDHRGDD